VGLDVGAGPQPRGDRALGPALSIELTSGRRFVVSVDDPEHAVAIVNRIGIRAA
jgi:hypothetical protein